MAKHAKRSRKQQTPLERADIDTARKAADYRETLPVRAIGLFGGLADQPPLTALALGIAGVGLFRGDRAVARAGLRMLAAHAVGTAAKTLLKTCVDRTRPALLVDEGRYELARGRDSDDHDRTSFPSGHTVGAVAAARAWGREFPPPQTRRLCARGHRGGRASPPLRAFSERCRGRHRHRHPVRATGGRNHPPGRTRARRSGAKPLRHRL